MGFKRDYILNNYDQSAVMAELLELGIEDVEYALGKGRSVCNVYRGESKASLSFRYYGNKLIAKDFGDINYRGDIFEIAGVVSGLNCNDSVQFNKICDYILSRMESNTSRYKRIVKLKEERDIEESIATSDCEITPIFRNFNKSDYSLFQRIGLNRDIVNRSYRAVRHYYINEFHSPYRYSDIDPCYYYVPNINKVKLYFPFRPHTSRRFISNNKFPIENIDELCHKDYLILIKSYKDKLLLNKIIAELKIRNILVLPLSSEAARLRKDVVDLLHKYIHRDIFVMTDPDVAGYKAAEFYRDVYNFKPLFPTESWKQKDMTDLCAQVGFIKTLDIIKKELEDTFKLKYYV